MCHVWIEMLQISRRQIQMFDMISYIGLMANIQTLHTERHTQRIWKIKIKWYDGKYCFCRQPNFCVLFKLLTNSVPFCYFICFTYIYNTPSIHLFLPIFTELYNVFKGAFIFTAITTPTSCLKNLINSYRYTLVCGIVFWLLFKI